MSAAAAGNNDTAVNSPAQELGCGGTKWKIPHHNH